MHTGNTFKMKTGYCQIREDKIILSRNPPTEELPEVPSKEGIDKILAIYSIVAIFFILLSFKGFSVGDTGIALFSLVIAGVVGIFLFQNRNNSASRVILRERIRAIEFKPALPRVQAACFTVYFEDEQQRIRKRLIPLTGSLAENEQDTAHALGIMQSCFPSLKVMKW